MQFEIESQQIKGLRTSKELSAVQTAVTKKLRGNLDAGDKGLAGWTDRVRQLSSEGKRAGFSGISAENNAKLVELKLEYDDESKQQFAERVVKPLKELALKHGIPVVFAGEVDQSPHTVLDVARFNEVVAPEDREVYVKQLKRKLRVGESMVSGKRNLLTQSLIDKELTFDTLFVGAPNTAICASTVDRVFKDVTKARKTFNHALQITAPDKVGPHYQTGYYNIAHVSVMKLIGDASPEALKAFADEAYGTVGHDLMKNPIKMKVANVYFGTSTDWNAKDRPDLFIPDGEKIAPALLGLVEQ